MKKEKSYCLSSATLAASFETYHVSRSVKTISINFRPPAVTRYKSVDFLKNVNLGNSNFHSHSLERTSIKHMSKDICIMGYF